jgi:hypothetical protein
LKFLLTLTLLISSTFAQASYFATKCSNADGTVTWVSGQMQNQAKIIYQDVNHTSQVASVSTWNLNFDFSNELVLRDEKVHVCGYVSINKVTASKVIITASIHAQDTLDFLPGENKEIITEVICQYQMSSRAGCPE